MREFIARQEFLFVATADRHGECDCTSKFGEPGFIRTLSEKFLAYPEYRGNGVFANLGNISENPHIAMLILDFFRDTVGLHVNGKARIIENEEMSGYGDKIPQDIGRVGERREKTAGALGHGGGGGSLHPML
jgi:predicted pyridoxine 5'-phosphate oxidase superfamily flavin-nucleotide-binding protein